MRRVDEAADVLVLNVEHAYDTLDYRPRAPTNTEINMLGLPSMHTIRNSRSRLSTFSSFKLLHSLNFVDACGSGRAKTWDYVAESVTLHSQSQP